jgi:hypothetical protein
MDFTGGIAEYVSRMRTAVNIGKGTNRLIYQMPRDPYNTGRKPGDSCVCPNCHAVFLNGHWQWTNLLPEQAPRKLCPACRRIKDNCPAGAISLKGNFVQTHKDELIHLLRNQETQEMAEHPLHRIIRIEEHPKRLDIQTTDIHLPKRIGDALNHAYKGVFHVRYEEAGYFVQVDWQKE